MRFISRLIAIISVVSILYYLIVVKFMGFPEGAGTFGDTFGGLNVIFTGAVLIISFYTLYKSESEGREQLKKQEIEMLLSEINKAHEKFDSENVNARFIEKCRVFPTIYQNLKRMNGPHSEEPWDHKTMKQKYVAKEVDTLIKNDYPEYFNYMTLIGYLIKRINNLKDYRARFVYKAIMATHFDLEKQMAIALFTLYYSNMENKKILEDLIQSNSLFTHSFILYLKNTKSRFKDLKQCEMVLETIVYEDLTSMLPDIAFQSEFNYPHSSFLNLL